MKNKRQNNYFLMQNHLSRGPKFHNIWKKKRKMRELNDYDNFDERKVELQKKNWKNQTIWHDNSVFNSTLLNILNMMFYSPKLHSKGRRWFSKDNLF